MSEIITVRDSDVIAAEICAIKENTRQIMIASSIAIGGKLTEAKAMVPYGEWGKWLEEKVNYSQSTANNMMLLYKEYGQGQENLFDNWTNSEAFANLSYTQHMALLALPFCDRAEFAERTDAENLSTRELEKAVREELERTKEQLQKTEDALIDARSDLQKTGKREKDARSEKDRAEKSEKAALDLVAKLEKQLKDAKAKGEKLSKELKEARENPKLSQDAMAQLRKEAAAEEVKKATEKLEKDLAEAQKRANAASVLAEEAEARLEAAQRAVKTANPVITEAIVRAKKLTADFNEMNGFRKLQQEKDPETAEKIRKMMADMVGKWKEELG